MVHVDGHGGAADAGEPGQVVDLVAGHFDSLEGGRPHLFFELGSAAGSVGDVEEDAGDVGGDDPVGVHHHDVAFGAGGDRGQHLVEQVSVADGLEVDVDVLVVLLKLGLDPSHDAVGAVPILVPDDEIDGFFHCVGHARVRLGGDRCAGG